MTYPACIDCKYMVCTGIGGIPSCNAPQREKKFDVIYGMVADQIACRDARFSTKDCSIRGNFFAPLDKIEPPVVESKRSWFSWFNK